MRIILFSVLIWSLYAVALFSPVGHNLDGWGALQGGWGGLGVIPESANVALLLGWFGLLLGRTRLATGLGIIAVALALTAPYIYGVELQDLRAGYFLWLGSCIVLAVAAATAEENDR